MPCPAATWRPCSCRRRSTRPAPPARQRGARTRRAPGPHRAGPDTQTTRPRSGSRRRAGRWLSPGRRSRARGRVRPAPGRCGRRRRAPRPTHGTGPRPGAVADTPRGQQNGKPGLERHRPVDQPDTDADRHQGDAERGQQLQDQRRQERGPQHAHGGAPIGVGHVADRRPLGVAPPEDLQGWQPPGRHPGSARQAATTCATDAGCDARPPVRPGP
jgi:hypothetical protein